MVFLQSVSSLLNQPSTLITSGWRSWDSDLVSDGGSILSSQQSSSYTESKNLLSNLEALESESQTITDEIELMQRDDELPEVTDSVLRFVYGFLALSICLVISSEGFIASFRPNLESGRFALKNHQECHSFLVFDFMQLLTLWTSMACKVALSCFSVWAWYVMLSS